MLIMVFSGFAALVPLEELKEINFTKQYGISRDSEVLDILDSVSKTKEVYSHLKLLLALFLIIVFFS